MTIRPAAGVQGAKAAPKESCQRLGCSKARRSGRLQSGLGCVDRWGLKDRCAGYHDE